MTREGTPLTVSNETILRIALFILLAIGSISFFEPSPYEIVFLVLVPLLFVLNQIVLTRVTLTLIIVSLIFLACEGLSLTPFFEDRQVPTEEGGGSTALVYTLQTTYLFISAIIFAIIFTRHTAPRLNLALTAYTISAIFAASWAVAGHFEIWGFHDTASIAGRVAGPFKDPNVLGSYSILGVLFLMQAILRGSQRLRLVNIAALIVTLFGGIFLPLSRGAWGAMAFAALYFGIVTYYTSVTRRLRRRIIVSVFGLMIIGIVASFYVASDATLMDTVTSRAKLEQDYDGGVTGRFGNQIRAIPMLLDRPLGFGPHRFVFYFDLDPHNSYIGAFSSAGWIGGTIFFVLIVMTSLISIRLTLVGSPYIEQAQVVVPALLSAFLQGFQIDIDHWRFVYLMLGAVWGMEAARQISRSRHAPLYQTSRLGAEPLALHHAPSPTPLG